MKISFKLAIICLIAGSLFGQDVQVRSYTRKDGTEVSAYTRSKPNRSDTNLYTQPGPSYGGGSHRVLSYSGHCAILDPGFIACGGQLLEYGIVLPKPPKEKHKRDPREKAAFERSHPCPANNRTSGSCPGYVVDHVVPLACGGADDPSNMQWQSVAEGKAKDKWERKVYCDK